MASKLIRDLSAMRLCLLMPLLLGGCAAAAAVSAIPGLFVDRAVGFFAGQEVSLPVDMQRALVGVQRGLMNMGLQVDVLEPIEDGYAVEFGNGELDGDIQLKRQTQKLTTLTVSAHRGLVHQASVEQTAAKEVRQAAGQAADGTSFDFEGYRKVYAKAAIQDRHLGWFRPGAMLHVKASRKAGWLKITLPSGKTGFIKGTLRDAKG